MSSKAKRLKIALTSAQNAALTLPAGTLVDLTDTGAIVRHNGSTAGGVAIGGGGGAAWGSITGTLANQTDLQSALASAGAETPTWANHFTANTTGITSYNAPTITPQYGSSAVDITTAWSNRGVECGTFTPSVSTSYLIVFQVITADAGVNCFTHGGGTLLGTASQAGWYAFRWTASAANKPTLQGVANAASTWRIGYIAVYTDPSANLTTWAPQGQTDQTLASLSAAKFTTATRRIYVGSGTTDPASAQASSPVCIGASAATQNDGGGSEGSSVAIGPAALTTTFTAAGGYTESGGNGRTAVGSNAEARSWRGTAVGAYASAVPVSSTALGFWAFAGQAHSEVFGRGIALTAQVPADSGASVGNAFVGFNGTDLYLGGGWAHVVPHPRNADDTTIPQNYTGANVPSNNPVTVHGIDAYDARAGGSAIANSQVADVTARNAIATANRWYGMDVYVTGDNHTYRLNIDWGADLSSNASWTDLGAGDLRSLNIAGGNLRVMAGRGTGSGASGKVQVLTAPIASAAANTKNAAVVAVEVDALVDAGNNKSRFLLYDTATGALRRVEFGAADSGGTGYRMLRTVN